MRTIYIVEVSFRRFFVSLSADGPVLRRSAGYSFPSVRGGKTSIRQGVRDTTVGTQPLQPVTMTNENKRYKVTRVHNDQFDAIFRYVGVLTQCKAVSRSFLSLDLIKHVRFYPGTSAKVVFSVLSKRNLLRSIDLTGCASVNNSIVHVLMQLFPAFELLVLDNCDGFEMFPTRRSDERKHNVYLKKNGTMKWGIRTLPVVSIKGCWKLYRPSYNITPETLTTILIRALQNGSNAAIRKFRSFCWTTNGDMSECFCNDHMMEDLQRYTSWRFVSQHIGENAAYVLIRVEDYAYTVWFYTREFNRNNRVWNLLVIWEMHIEKMWFMCKKYVTM